MEVTQMTSHVRELAEIFDAKWNPEYQLNAWDLYSTNQTPEELSVFNEVLESYRKSRVEFFDFGLCGVCYNPCALYVWSYGLTKSQPYCAYHVWNMMLSHRVVRIINNYIFPSQDTFKTWLGELETDRPKCGVCSQYILIEGDRNLNEREASAKNWGTFVEITTLTGEVAQVHNACHVKCEECGLLGILERSFYRNSQRFSSKIKCVETDDGFICPACRDSQGYWLCEWREHWVSGDSFWSDARSLDMCESCYDDEFLCGTCDSHRYEDNHECHDREDNSTIHDYSYKPVPKFFGIDDYYFGVELEVEAEDNDTDVYRYAEQVNEFFNGRAYCKHDGSLDNGFEIVTHPHSFTEWQRLDLSILRQLSRNGFRSWDNTNCGLHVHISRTAFKNKDHELKFQKLIYDNATMVQAIAGRVSQYANFNDKGNLVAKVKEGQPTERFSAVNSLNDATLEVRIFRGSLNAKRVKSAVEFLRASIEYTRDLKIKPKQNPLSWFRFMAHVMDTPDTYPNFVRVGIDSLSRLKLDRYATHEDEE